MKSIRVVIFEDNNALREGMFSLIDGSDGFTCVGAFPNCRRVLESIGETRPDVVLMDIEMPGIKGTEAVSLIKANFPHVKVLMQTVFEDDEKIFQSICNGAEGYVLKNTQPAAILEAIKEINTGGAPMTPAIALKVMHLFKENLGKKSANIFNLSAREKEVLKCLVEGMSYKMVAAKCFISIETVRGYIKTIYEKLQVHSKSEVVAKAIRNRIVS